MSQGNSLELLETTLMCPSLYRSRLRTGEFKRELRGAWPVRSRKESLSHLNFGRSDRSVGKESACNAGDLGSIPGLGRSPGEGIGYPLQYSWASLVAQLVKILPAVRETWVQSVGWEDPLEKGKATHSSILASRIPWTG